MMLLRKKDFCSEIIRYAMLIIIDRVQWVFTQPVGSFQKGPQSDIYFLIRVQARKSVW